jgi:hypothetical protein
MLDQYLCRCIECRTFFSCDNEFINRCFTCEEAKYRIEEDSDTLEDALVEAEGDLMRANARIDLLLEILSSYTSFKWTTEKS